MNEGDISRISQAIIARGIAGQSEVALLYGFCADCNEIGLDLAIATAVIDTLHPIHEGRAFHWPNGYASGGDSLGSRFGAWTRCPGGRQGPPLP